MSITTLGASAFSGTSITSVVLPDTITSIGDSCFQSCLSLKEATVSNSMTSIPPLAFADCPNLDTITIPKVITSIDNTSFDNCVKLKTNVGPPYAGTLITNAVEGEYVYDFFLPPGTNGFYVNVEEPICFNEGTWILCLSKDFKEEYIQVEKLTCGDIVKTYKHGYRKILAIGKNTMLNNPEVFSNCMYKMKATAENEMLDDLIITGGHSILVDDLGTNEDTNKTVFHGETLKIDDKFLLASAASPQFEKINEETSFTYYHFTLQNDGDPNARYGVWANGVLTETPSFNQFFVANLKPL